MADLFYQLLVFIGYEHPLHPVLTHLVVGPVIAAFIFELIGVFKKNSALRNAAWYLTLLSFVFWFFTVSIGLIDWSHFYNMSRVTDITIKIILSGVLVTILITRILLKKRLAEDSIVPLILLGLATLNVAALGFFGGNLVFGGSGRVEAGEVTTSEAGYSETAVEGFTLEWRTNIDTLDLRLRFPTTGWIAVGFGATGEMEGSDIYIGYVADDGTVTVVDSYGTSPQTHAPDIDEGGQDNVTNVSGETRRGTTTISFTIPLESGDSRDMVYVEGKTYQVIIAHAGDGVKDTESYHGADGRLTFALTL